MNYYIRNTLEREGFEINEQAETITRELCGINSNIEIFLDYKDFDDMTIAEVCNIYEFFPDREDYISMEEDYCVTYMVDKQRACGDLYTGYLQTIINTWEMEEKALRREFQELNRSLLVAFSDLEDKVVDKDNFADFLDCLSFVDGNKCVYVSSHYSDYRYYGASWDEFYELIVGYIIKLVQREEIIFEDFTFSDDIFWDTLREKEWKQRPDVK